MSQRVKLLTVTDLHQGRVLYDQLRRAVESHRPDVVALVGDFLDGGDSHAGQLSVAECAASLARLCCAEVVFVRGNHEHDNWWEFVAAWRESGRPLRALHGSAFVHGPLVLVGFPCLMGDEAAFVESLDKAGLPYALADSAEADWLPDVLLPHGPASRTVWLMHEPPAGTPLSKAGSVVEGNPEWTAAIERYSPWLTVSGHDHVTPRRSGRWHCRVDRTVCVNAGQTDEGPLRYCVITAEFTSAKPALPKRMTVQLHPGGETLVLPL